MWVRKRLDIGWRDLAAGALACLLPGRQADCQARAEQAWLEPRQTLAVLSVRSGLDLLLEALELPAQSEVLLAAYTVPGMVRVIEAHHLVPVPVDLSRDTMGPDPACLRRAITPRSRVLVAAHLLGGRFPMEPILEIAREHRLLVVEDCAQAFDGGAFGGHPQADVSMFSFGMIKTATALGGGLLRVHDPKLLAMLRRCAQEKPVQSRAAFCARVVQCALLKTLSSPVLFAAVVHGCMALGLSYDRFVNRTVRSFAEPQFLERIRRRPSAPLLALLERRLTHYDRQRVAVRTQRGELLAELLSGRVFCPGRDLESPSYWVFPILAENPEEVIVALRQAGFDATQGQSMCAVSPPPDRPGVMPTVARQLVEKIVYLPLYTALPESAVRTIARVVGDVAQWPAGIEHPDDLRSAVRATRTVL